MDKNTGRKRKASDFVVTDMDKTLVENEKHKFLLELTWTKHW